MTHNDNERDVSDWLDKTRSRLDHTMLELDPEVKRRLHQARRQALDSAKTRSGLSTSWMLPMTGVATAALALVVVLNFEGTQPELNYPEENLADMQLLRSSADLDFLEELEFYMWLEHEDSLG